MEAPKEKKVLFDFSGTEEEREKEWQRCLADFKRRYPEMTDQRIAELTASAERIVRQPGFQKLSDR